MTASIPVLGDTPLEAIESAIERAEAYMVLLVILNGGYQVNLVDIELDIGDRNRISILYRRRVPNLVPLDLAENNMGFTLHRNCLKTYRGLEEVGMVGVKKWIEWMTSKTNRHVVEQWLHSEDKSNSIFVVEELARSAFEAANKGSNYATKVSTVLKKIGLPNLIGKGKCIALAIDAAHNHRCPKSAKRATLRTLNTETLNSKANRRKPMKNKLALFVVGMMLLATTTKAEWRSSVDDDKFTGETRTVASTHTYGGTPNGSSLVVRCKGGELDVFMSFGYLNLTDATTRRYGRSVRLKYIFDGGDVRGDQDFTYSKSGNGLFFFSKESDHNKTFFIEGLRSSSSSVAWFPLQFTERNTFSVRLNYHSAGVTDVTFDLTGAAPHIRKVLETCGVSPEDTSDDHYVTELDSATWICMTAKHWLEILNKRRKRKFFKAAFDEYCPNAASEAEYCRIGRKFIRLDDEIHMLRLLGRYNEAKIERMMLHYCEQAND